MQQSTIEVVAFDAVGTLIYPDPGVAAVYTAVGRQFGSKLDQAEVGRRFHQAFADEEATTSSGDTRTSELIETDRWRRIVRRVLSDATDPARCFMELFAHFARPDAWRLFPDVSPVLASLRAAGIR